MSKVRGGEQRALLMSKVRGGENRALVMSKVRGGEKRALAGLAGLAEAIHESFIYLTSETCM